MFNSIEIEKSRSRRELAVENEVLLAQGNNANSPKVPIVGLQLPQVLGISVQVGNALPLDALRGQPATTTTDGSTGASRMPVPFVPEQC